MRHRSRARSRHRAGETRATAPQHARATLVRVARVLHDVGAPADLCDRLVAPDAANGEPAPLAARVTGLSRASDGVERRDGPEARRQQDVAERLVEKKH